MKLTILPTFLLLAHQAAAALALAQAAHTPAKRQLSRGRHVVHAKARAQQHELRGLLDTLTELLGGDPDEDTSASSSSLSTTATTTPAGTSPSAAPSSSPTAITDPPPTSVPSTTASSSSTETSDPCDGGLLGGIIGIIGGCTPSTTSPATTTVTPTVVPPASTTPVVTGTPSQSGSASDSATVDPTATPSGSASTTAEPAPTTTTTAAPTSTDAPCTPLVVLGITLSECEPFSTSASGTTTTDASTTIPSGTASGSASGTASGSDPATTTAPPDTTGTGGPTTTADPTSTDSCAPLVLLGATILPCETPTTSASTAGTTSTDAGTGTGSGTGGGQDPTTTAGPTGTGSSSSTPTTTSSDPCDPGLLGLLGILPASCTPTSTSGTGGPTGTGGTTTDGPTTTGSDGPTTTGPTTTGSDSVTDTTSITTTNTLDPNPTDIFPGGSDTDSSITYSSTSSISTVPTDLPTVTIPVFVTQTSELLIETDLPTTPTALPSNTDPDAVQTSTPIAQSSSSQPTKNVLPNNLPSFILAATAPQSQPAGYTLVTIMLSQRLNWDWVASNSQTALQIITFAPLTVVNALRLQQQNVIMLALEAFIPENWNRDPKSLLTLVEMYIPDQHVDELAQQLRARNSAFYTQQANQVEVMLVAEVDPSYPLTAGGGGAASGGGSPLAPLINGNESNGKDDARKRAIIGVCAAIGGAVALALAWWLYKYMQRSREMRHRRLSQNSDTNLGAAAMAGGAYGATGVMEERGRRDSFFFAADSLRGYEDGMGGGAAAMRYEDDTYDHRAGAPAGGARSPQQGPIVPSHISAPILRENTLNW